MLVNIAACDGAGDRDGDDRIDRTRDLDAAVVLWAVGTHPGAYGKSLRDVINAVDYLWKTVLSHEVLEGAFNRLLTAGLLKQPIRGYELTPEGRRVFDAEDPAAPSTVSYIERLADVLADQPTNGDILPWQLDPNEYDAAVAAHTHRETYARPWRDPAP